MGVNVRKRDRLEVIYDILNKIRENRNSIKVTPLIRKSNLSSASFSDYMMELSDKEFVKEIIDNKGGRYITLTNKGFRYIEKYSQFKGFIQEFEL